MLSLRRWREARSMDFSTEAVMSTREPNDRDDRVEALARGLFAVLNTDPKGCTWQEVPEAVGLMLKTFGIAICTMKGADEEEVRAISAEINQRFNQGYSSRTVIVRLE
jgi:hypothetical protein